MDILDGITVICSSWWDQNEKKTIERIKKHPLTAKGSLGLKSQQWTRGWTEPDTGRNYALIVKKIEKISRGKWASFFWSVNQANFIMFCFPEVSGLGIRALTHKISFRRNLNFGHRQDTKQVDRADQKPLFGVNYPFCNTDIWVKMVSSLLFLVLLLLISPAKVWAFDVSKYCSKNHNGGFLQNVWAKYATQTFW